MFIVLNTTINKFSIHKAVANAIKKSASLWRLVTVQVTKCSFMQSIQFSYCQTLNYDAIWRNSNENETLWTNYKGRVWSETIIYSLVYKEHQPSSYFPTFLLIFVMCFPKFRESSNVSPNRSTASTNGKATPLANSDSLTLGFRARTSALHFLGFKIILLLRNHHTPPQVPYWEHVRQQLDQYQQNTADYHQYSWTASPLWWNIISRLWRY